MMYDKIFVIGFNKTGTTSLHKLFLKLNLSSQHSPNDWELDRYQCFTDGDHISPKFINYYRLYPNSLFILNTRPLKNWMISRSKHCYAYKQDWGGWPPDYNHYIAWIIRRHNHYNNVLDFFIKDPQKLIICNIEQEGWENFVTYCINGSLQKDNNQNKIHEHKIDSVPSKIISKIKESIASVFSDLDYNTDKQMQLLTENPNISLYKSHI